MPSSTSPTSCGALLLPPGLTRHCMMRWDAQIAISFEQHELPGWSESQELRRFIAGYLALLPLKKAAVEIDKRFVEYLLELSNERDRVRCAPYKTNTLRLGRRDAHKPNEQRQNRAPLRWYSLRL